MTNDALAGITIIDLSRYGPGRYCSMMLADFGARVITVEVPRNSERLPAFLTDDTAPRYLAYNRNKESIAINLKHESGRQVLFELMEGADVLLEGFRPGVTRKMGIDYPALKNRYPGLIYCSISGFGQDGPYKMRPGHDLNYVAMSGMLELSRPAGASPPLIGAQIGDLLGGCSQASMAILIALLEKQQSGKGQYIDISILDGLVHSLWHQGAEYLLTGKYPENGKHILTGQSAGYMLYETADATFLSIGCFEPAFWKKLCGITGKECFLNDQYAEGERRSLVMNAFKEEFKMKPRSEWLKILAEADIPCGPVNSIEETFGDPQVKHRQMVVSVKHRKLGPIRHIGIPLKLSRTPGKIRHAAPAYGEHTDEVLLRLGYTRDAIDELKSNGTID